MRITPNPTSSTIDLHAAQSLREKITKITDRQIELVAHLMGGKILQCLGLVNKQRIIEQINRKAPSRDINTAMLNFVLHRLAHHKIEEGNESFLSDADAGRFLSTILVPLSREIQKKLSAPQFFMEAGVRLQLSDYDPMGVLHETAQHMSLDLTSLDILPKYWMYLKLDQKLTQEKSKLVFSLTEVSEGNEFSSKTFTLDELEQTSLPRAKL